MRKLWLLLCAASLAACSGPSLGERENNNSSKRPSKDDSAAGSDGDGDRSGSNSADDDDDSDKVVKKELDTSFDQFDSFFEQKRIEAGAPGMSVAVVKGGRVRWAKGYGLADIDAQRAATKDTVYLIASISKPVVATALMQLIADTTNGIALDTDINEVLPFSVRNPNFPDVPITFRMILTHTSSLVGLSNDLDTVQGDWPATVSSVVTNSVGNADAWSTSAPGTVLEYSNTAFALAAVLVEQISGITFEAYTQKHIFEPLDMNESSWFSKSFDSTHVAMPYEDHDSVFTPQGHYGWGVYPCGSLRTSALQLGRFMSSFTHKKEDTKATRVLPQSIIDEMMESHIPDIDPNQGLSFFMQAFGDHAVMGHSGGFLGVSTDMFWDLDTGAGFVLLTNGSAYFNKHVLDTQGIPAIESQGKAMEAIDIKLFELASSIPN